MAFHFEYMKLFRNQNYQKKVTDYLKDRNLNYVYVYHFSNEQKTEKVFHILIFPVFQKGTEKFPQTVCKHSNEIVHEKFHSNCPNMVMLFFKDSGNCPNMVIMLFSRTVETAIGFPGEAVKRLLRVMTTNRQFDHMRVETSSNRCNVDRMVERRRNFWQNYIPILEFSNSWKS